MKRLAYFAGSVLIVAAGTGVLWLPATVGIVGYMVVAPALGWSAVVCFRWSVSA